MIISFFFQFKNNLSEEAMIAKSRLLIGTNSAKASIFSPMRLHGQKIPFESAEKRKSLKKCKQSLLVLQFFASILFVFHIIKGCE